MARRLLAVHAHPDDESSKGAATAAHYRDLGDEVLVVSCTGGERGSVLNPGLAARAHAERDMAGLRALEMARAREILGVEHVWLGYEDSGLPTEGDPVPPRSFATIPVEHAAVPLVRLIRRFRPHVLVTYDENGGYPHPDHIRTHEVAVHARRWAADAAWHPCLGDAWTTAKLYYDRTHNPARLRALRDALLADGSDAVLAAELTGMLEWMGDRPDSATTRVPCGEQFERRDAALRAHASQVAPDSAFFFLPNDLQRRVWPTEDFELVDTLVATTPPEDDLFAGLDPEA